MKLVILGTPKPKQSCRFTKRGIKYTPKEVKQAESNIRAQVVAQLPAGFTPWTDGIVVKKLLFVFRR